MLWFLSLKIETSLISRLLLETLPFLTRKKKGLRLFNLPLLSQLKTVKELVNPTMLLGLLQLSLVVSLMTVIRLQAYRAILDVWLK
jgi:hypothetical protein